MKLVNIGGQKNREKGPFKNWIVIDVRDGSEIKIDVSKQKIPLEDNSVDAIYSSHTFEHIHASLLPNVFKECYRILKPKSLIRIVVPDIDIALSSYFKNPKFLADSRNPQKLGCLPDMSICYLMSWFYTYDFDKNNIPLLSTSFGHAMVFNFELMKYYLSKFGFSNISKLSFNVSNPIFSKCDYERYKDCSLYVEAVK